MAFTAPVLAALATLLLQAPAAPPDAKEQAKTYADRGRIAYNLGHYDEAAYNYESAYRLVQDPILLFNIGQSYRNAGKLDRALPAYKGFLRTAPANHANRAVAETRVQEIEKQLEAERRAAQPPPAATVTGAPAPTPAEAPATAPPPAGVQPAAPAAPAPVAAPPGSGPPGGQPASQPPQQISVVVPMPAESAAPEPGLRATLGGHLGAAGRANDKEHGAAFYRGFGRLADMSNRTYELGYFSEPIYPMNPRYQLSALYGVFNSAGGWSLTLGALGHDGGWIAATAWQYEILSFGVRFDGLEAPELCGDSQGTLAYIVPQAGLRIPATPKLLVTGLAAYRGKLVKSHCDFRPSLLTLDLAAHFQATESWRFSGGAGHYGLHDFGGGSPAGPWPSNQSSSMFLHAGAALGLGRITLRLDLRHIFYVNGVTEGTLGIEFRSRKDAP